MRRASPGTLASTPEEAAASLREVRAAARRLPPGSFPILVAPACDAPTRPLGRARRTLFEQHLRETLRALAAGEPAAGPVLPPEVAVSPAADEVLRDACRACRGSCCRTGGAHAYQTVDSLRRVRAARPGLSDEELLALYRSHLPARSVRGSCVFHGRAGCALPRELRGDMCNRFLCTPLEAWRDRALGSGSAAAFVVAWDDGLLRGGWFHGGPARGAGAKRRPARARGGGRDSLAPGPEPT